MLPAMHDPTPGGQNDGGVDFIIDAVGCFNVLYLVGYPLGGSLKTRDISIQEQIILATAQQY